MKPKKYRPREVTVEAMRVGTSAEENREIAQWCQGFIGGSGTHPWIAVVKEWVSSNQVRTETAHVGDYIVRGITGLFFVVQAEEFSWKYKLATQGDTDG